MGEKSKKAWDHLKSNQNLYTIVCMISALVGIYADYQAKVSDLASEQDTIEGKAKNIDSERVEADTLVQKNLNLVFERAITLENRLTIIETKLSRVEKDNSSFWKIILGRRTVSAEEPVYYESIPEVVGPPEPYFEGGEKAPEKLEQIDIDPVF